MLKINRIYCGDCLRVMQQISSKSIDMVLTDIPYDQVTRPDHGLRNLNKADADILTFNLNIFMDALIRITKGSIYICCGWGQMSFILDKLIASKLSTRMIIWQKSNPSPMNGQYIWLSGVEPIAYGKFSGATFNAHCRNTVLKYPSGRSKIHPTQKNLALFEDLIQVSSNEGDLILDPCLGSGTTAIAAMRLKRNFIGIELNMEYCKIANERLRGEL